ncbi:GNAT family N-acetyltransferase, partial [Variovorax sp. CT11-76]
MPATALVETLDALSPRELPQLDALVAASGWNQLAADWRLFERLGSVHAIRDGEGTIVASGAVLPLERAADAPRNQPGAAWISMILVAPAARGQGLG